MSDAILIAWTSFRNVSDIFKTTDKAFFSFLLGENLKVKERATVLMNFDTIVERNRMSGFPDLIIILVYFHKFFVNLETFFVGGFLILASQSFLTKSPFFLIF